MAPDRWEASVTGFALQNSSGPQHQAFGSDSDESVPGQVNAYEADEASGHMADCSKILIVLSVLVLFAGVALLVFTATVLRYVAWDDVYVLTTRYDPNDDAGYQSMRTYENLYDWTTHLVQHRNQFAMRFYYTLGASLMVFGVLLIAWTIDRERVRRGLIAPKGDRNRQSNGAAGNAQ